VSGPRIPTSADGADPSSEQLSTHRFLTAPNLFTLLRLCCIPIFCWLLFGKDDQVAAAWLLGGLGATDWVDGWLMKAVIMAGGEGTALCARSPPTARSRCCPWPTGR
jgi:hypothetical protein